MMASLPYIMIEMRFDALLHTHSVVSSPGELHTVLDSRSVLLWSSEMPLV